MIICRNILDIITFFLQVISLTSQNRTVLHIPHHGDILPLLLFYGIKKCHLTRIFRITILAIKQVSLLTKWGCNSCVCLIATGFWYCVDLDCIRLWLVCHSWWGKISENFVFVRDNSWDVNRFVIFRETAVQSHSKQEQNYDLSKLFLINASFEEEIFFQSAIDNAVKRLQFMGTKEMERKYKEIISLRKFKYFIVEMKHVINMLVYWRAKILITFGDKQNRIFESVRMYFTNSSCSLSAIIWRILKQHPLSLLLNISPKHFKNILVSVTTYMKFLFSYNTCSTVFILLSIIGNFLLIGSNKVWRSEKVYVTSIMDQLPMDTNSYTF